MNAQPAIITREGFRPNELAERDVHVLISASLDEGKAHSDRRVVRPQAGAGKLSDTSGHEHGKSVRHSPATVDPARGRQLAPQQRFHATSKTVNLQVKVVRVTPRGLASNPGSGTRSLPGNRPLLIQFGGQSVANLRVATTPGDDGRDRSGAASCRRSPLKLVRKPRITREAGRSVVAWNEGRARAVGGW